MGERDPFGVRMRPAPSKRRAEPRPRRTPRAGRRGDSLRPDCNAGNLCERRPGETRRANVSRRAGALSPLRLDDSGAANGRPAVRSWSSRCGRLMVAQSGDLRLAYRDMSVQGFNRPALAPNVYHRVAIRTYHYQLRKKHVAPLVGSLTEWRLMVNVGKSCSNFSVA